MNNIVEIIYSKGERYPQISINGEKISRYMELADWVFDDIYNWADKFYESMDDELCEDYTVLLTGHSFQYQVLKALQSRSGHCSAVRFTPIEHKISVEDKVAYARELNQQYHLGVRAAADKICFSTDDPERFQSLVPCEDETGNYFITAGTTLPEKCGKCCIMLSEQMHFEKVRGISVLHVPEHQLSELLDYLNLYHLHMEYLSAVFSAVNDLTLSQDEKLKYEAYIHEEYRIHISPLPEIMDAGERFELAYVFYPQQFGDPGITLSTNNPAVVFTSDSTLIAQSAGVATVMLTDKNGALHGTYQIRVEQHNYVTGISVVLPATTLCVNETLRFKCLLSPSDAEDIAAVRYTISDNTVAAFSAPNEIYGVAPGRVKVTVSTPRISKCFYITVLPVPKNVLLPGDKMSLPVNAEAFVNCCVVPTNASPKPTASWVSSNPRVLRVAEYHDYTCKVVSGETGKATLTCSLDGTHIAKTMEVEVHKEGGCYVATAVYGSYDCPQVWVLRRYRDQFLASSFMGRAFIKVYYAVSPMVVKCFGRTKWFNRLWRGILDGKIRKLKACGYEDTPYND